MCRKSTISLILLILFCNQFSHAQFKTTKTYSSYSSFCSTTYVLDSLGYFFRESGCEGRSHIALGTYKIAGDTVIFTFLSVEKFPPVLNIEEIFPDSLKTGKIIFNTRFNEPLRSDFRIDALKHSGEFYKTIALNEQGEGFIKYRKGTSLRLLFFNNISGRWVDINSKSNNLKITLSFPGIFFKYHHHLTEPNESLLLLLKEDGLYDLTGNPFCFLQKNK